MSDLSKLPQCPSHGRYTGRSCPICDWSPEAAAKPAPAVAADAYDRTNWHTGPESDLHDWFESDMIRRGVSFVRCRMDKPSTIRVGWPDFSLFFTAPDGITRACFVEFKSKSTVINKDQVEVHAELRERNIPCLVTGNFREAVEFVLSNLNLPCTQP